MRVADVMTHDVVCCHPLDSLRRAGELMWSRDVGSLPVLDYDDRPIAMITDRDIAMAAAIRGMPLHDMQVQACMSERLITCGPNDTAESVEAKMRTNQVHRLPVIDRDRVVGIVSLNDIARAVVPKAPRGDARDVLETLGAITHPRSAPLATV